MSNTGGEGMSGAQGYRQPAPRCPACSTLMSGRAAGEALVDVCPACRGVWLDWFDGDAPPVARELAPLSRPSHALVAPAPEGGRCPRCQAALYAEPYAGPEGPEIMRCGECAGSFVPRSAFDALAALTTDEAPEPEAPASFFRRLIEVVRDLIRP
ncbi:MAG TPA: zf-TFIIB domain-containing protein [Polyangiaceae bacterium]|nr:zf-TFIIB domain-containing protein [Polyangiaceae bacterium]